MTADLRSGSPESAIRKFVRSPGNRLALEVVGTIVVTTICAFFGSRIRINEKRQIAEIDRGQMDHEAILKWIAREHEHELRHRKPH